MDKKTMNEIRKIRTYIDTHFSNTAWRRATHGAPLDFDHIGKELWALWYDTDPKHLSLQTIENKSTLANWKILEKKLKIAFTNSVNAQNSKYNKP